MNGPFNMIQLFQAARNSQNPMQLLQGILGQNPQMSQAQKMIQGKSPEQLKQVAQNLAKERGIDLTAFAEQLGIKLP